MEEKLKGISISKLLVDWYAKQDKKKESVAMCYVINHQESNYLDLTKDRLLDLGYSKDTIKKLINELSKQSLNVQATFYHRLNGFTNEDIADMLNIQHRKTISYYIQNNLKNIKELLKNYAPNL